MHTDAIETHDLTKHYGRKAAVAGIDLAVPKGCIFGFLGPNASGKTTTIRMLMGFLRSNDGTARIFGLDCWRDSRRAKQHIGYLPGDLRLYPWMTVRNALAILGKVRQQDLERAGQELATSWDLDLNVRVDRMSRGTRQKLGLVLALVHRPSLLILDEPTTGLDPPAQDQLFEHLRRGAQAGQTTFFSSHVLSEVEHLCDQVAMLREGKIVARGALSDLRRQAPREATLTWKNGVVMDGNHLPPGLNIIAQSDCVWRCLLDGDSMEFIRWAANQPLVDVSVGLPSLQNLFRAFYGANKQNSTRSLL